MNEEHMELGGIYRVKFLEGLVRLYSSNVMDAGSLYSPAEGKKEFVPEELEDEEPDLLLRREKIRRLTEKMQRILSPEKIEKYVEKQLGDKDQLPASHFPLDHIEDFIKIIYIRLYGQRKNMRYSIEVLEEIETKGYRFRNFIVRRKP